MRSLIKFDLSAIPANANLVGAFLSLYAHQNQTIGNINNGPTYGNANQSFLSQVLVPWSPSAITWNTQPPVSPLNNILIPQSSSANQNYINIDITTLCQLSVSNPSSNFGWMLHLQNETAYNGLIFGSGEYPDSSMLPKLIVIYNLPNGISNNTNNIAVKTSFDKQNNLAIFEFENPSNEIATIPYMMLPEKYFFQNQQLTRQLLTIMKAL